MYALEARRPSTQDLLIQADAVGALLHAVLHCIYDHFFQVIHSKWIDITCDENDKTALMYAAEHGYTGKIRKLLQAGARVNARNARGMAALMYAARGEYLESIELLLREGADINAQSTDGRTFLNYLMKTRQV